MRAPLIREALGEFLAARRAETEIDRYVSGYERTPPSEPDAWGDLERAGDIDGHELAQRLDAEESAAGESW